MRHIIACPGQLMMYADIVIIGAGPCGLAAAARLREQTPSALFTNDEHARFWRKHKQHRNSLENELKQRKVSVDSGYASQNEDANVPRRPSILVLDAHSDQWLGSWKQRFLDLSISHLRSPLFFHPDPGDRDGLLAFAHEQGRVHELREIPNVAGKELSKHERKKQHKRKQGRTTARHLRIDGRDQIDYFTPSTELFHDYCEAIIDRYELRKIVRKTEVRDITYSAKAAEQNGKVFTIVTEAQEDIRSKVVIVATGASTTPRVPLPGNASEKHGITHVFDSKGTHLPSYLDNKLRSGRELVTILIVGGGLTSAQIADLLLTRYSDRRNLRVHLLLRHPKLKVKPFDIDLPWVSKTRNHMMSSFYLADSDQERMSMLKQARNGGSVTPIFAKVLLQHEGTDRLEIHVSTELNLKNAQWCVESQRWYGLDFRNNETGKEPPHSASALPQTAHHIIYCTSASPSMHNIPWLHNLQQSHPIETIAGLPVLTEDLAWSKDVPCFFSGALGALRLGPGAANLMGARLGAERIAWSVEDMLGLRSLHQSVERAQLVSMNREGNAKVRKANIDSDADDFTGPFSNQYAALSMA